jgi:hypothetical protein
MARRAQTALSFPAAAEAIIEGVDDNLPVHPAAAIFPMMDADALRELAGDIASNGLVNAIIVGSWTDADGTWREGVIDGRNRLKACAIAKVAPRFERLADGTDPLAFIISINVQRRQLSKGQQAMAEAIIHPEPDERGRGKKAVAPTGFSRERLQRARSVLAEASDLAMDVMRGGVPLDQAYQQTLDRRRQRAFRDQSLQQLRDGDPNLADQVEAGDLSLDAALERFQQQQREIQQARDAGRRAAERLLDFCTVAITIDGAASFGERGLVTDPMMARLEDAMTLLRRRREMEKGPGHDPPARSA